MTGIKNKYDLKEYVGKWVVLDEQDRLIAIDNSRGKVIEALEYYSMIKKDNYGAKIYYLHEEAIKNAIRILLDD